MSVSERVNRVAAAVVAVLTLSAAVLFALLRTTGIGPFRYASAAQPLALAIETIAIAVLGLAFLRPGPRSSVAFWFFGLGFLAVEAVALGLGLDVSSAPLQMACVAALVGGLAAAWKSRSQLRAAMVAAGLVSGMIVAAVVIYIASVMI